jgi:iron complex outermembrane receptor protein
VINVITRRQERTLHVQADQGATAGGGGIWYWQDPARDLTLSLNATGLTGDGGEVRVAQDALYAVGRSTLSQAPGPANDAHRYGGLFAELRWQGAFATLKLLDDAYGDQFGINHFLPPADQDLVTHQRDLAVEVGRDLRFSDTLSARVRLEGLQYERERDGLYVFPAGYLAEQPIYMNQRYRETRYLGAAELHWRPEPRHDLLFGLEASRIDIHDASWDWPALPFPIAATWLDATRERRILSGIIQDVFRAGEQVTLTGSLRYDDYSDLDAYLSPRLAAVWRLDSRNILKFQYAQAFRPPTFYELEYPSREPLVASEIATYELGYIRKQPTWETRLILFHSDLTGPISFDYVGLNGYVNNPDAHLSGVELEYQQRLSARVKIDANLSYVDAAWTGTGTALPGGTDLLGNFALLWRVADDWTAALQLRYVGERSRVEPDPRESLAGYGSLDLTLNYRRAGAGPFLSVGVKNLTDADQRFPDIPTRVADVDLVYPQDYPQPGRRWWLSAGYTF